MALRELASAEAALDWLTACGARALALDSRRVRPGDAFIAWPGHAVDPRRFVDDALAAGAAACLVEADGADAFPGLDGRPGVAALRGLKAAAGPIADGFLGHPSRRLRVLAVTGTNGKTSTAWWLAQALGALGRRCGVVGTLGVGEPPALVSTGLTTPDPVALQTAFRRFADEGFDACAIEASSIGIEEQRLAGTAVGVALFTNLTQDHLDYHGSMDAYRASKAKLFAWPGLRHAVLNVDDAEGAALARSLDGSGLDVWTVSARGETADGATARLAAVGIRHGDGGVAFDVRERGAVRATVARVTTRLVGAFNVANALGVIGGLRALGVPLADAARVCAALTPVPGRMQRVTVEGADDGAQPQVVVDYAHTPDALAQALAALRPAADGRGGRLWCVFGCGGNRDATKRAHMGAIAARLADRTVVTSDNPRDEAPAAIVAEVKAGADAVAGAAVEAVVDRAEAIARALAAAGPRDVVLIAGKGHEDYQEIAGVKRPFSDIAVAQDLLRRRASDMNPLSCGAGA